MKTQRRDTKGFTLIELLVVISIISLLMSILLPALGAARATAKGIICGNNQRQIAIAFGAYLADNKDHYPSGYEDSAIAAAAGRSSGQRQTWGYALWNYANAGMFLYPSNDLRGDMGVQDTNVFHCPIISEHVVGLTNATATQLVGILTVPKAINLNTALYSYAMNLTTAYRILNINSGPVRNGDGLVNKPAELSISAIEFTQPSATINVLEAASESTYCKSWSGWAAGWLPHDGYKSSNALFHDGHVKRLRYVNGPSDGGLPDFGSSGALDPIVSNTVWTHYQ